MTHNRKPADSIDTLRNSDDWSGLDRDNKYRFPDFENTRPPNFLTIICGYVALVLFGVAIAT